MPLLDLGGIVGPTGSRVGKDPVFLRGHSVRAPLQNDLGLGRVQRNVVLGVFGPDVIHPGRYKAALNDTPAGNIWAYEVDGFGGEVLMDDANVPSLLGLPYLDASPDPAMYARTRSFVWSKANPWFFTGRAGEGIGGPHIGRDSIWPMSQIVFALTSSSPDEIGRMLQLLKAGSAGTGFIHESYKSDHPQAYTRAWFAWANTLFGELVGRVAARFPQLIAS